MSGTMIAPTSPTPCMPYVAMVQPSTITKKLHNPLNTMKVPKPMSNPTYNHNYIDVFSCTNVNHTFHFMLPANTVPGYIQQAYLHIIQAFMYPHDYIVTASRCWRNCTYWELLVNYITLYHWNSDMVTEVPESSLYSAQYGGGSKRYQSSEQWTWEQLRVYVKDEHKLAMPSNMPRDIFIFTHYCDEKDMSSFASQTANLIAAQIPVSELLCLPRKHLLSIGKVHGLDSISKLSVDYLWTSLKTHTCSSSCNSPIALLQKHKGHTLSTKRVQRFRMHTHKSPSDQIKYVQFPPEPPSKQLMSEIIYSFANEVNTDYHAECGCAVCGKLTSVSHMVPLASVHNKIYLLEGEGSITRRERHTDDDPIEEIKGPILLPNADVICHQCRSSLAYDQVPVAALANGLWIGEVPEQLQNLTWAERTMIARVNHNRCVVRVKGSLQSKMMANAVCHTIPIPKVYNALPPGPEELDEVLAYIYIGPTRPVAKDHHRTPLLVRHNKVAAALEWLKLNHIDYADLTISYDNLKKYSEDGPPVVVDYHPGDGGKDEEAMAANDSQENEGTTEGPCPFVVHGLVGEQLMSMSTNALRAFALQHFKNKNHKALGIGQSEHPESLYSNPQLYPQMFPWLFPYGLGGPGNTRGFHQIPERERKCQLLMYHDKRFQNEPYFPLIAFNHEQIKDSTSGGFLLAEQHRFPDIANRILNLNNEVLDSLVNKLKEGQHYKPETQAEKDCYQLIQDVDHVAYKVKGSLTNRKHMRNEIWSLISYLGAPSWFITFAPADVKHPLCLYFAHTGETFKPELLDNDARTRMIASNPVAGARFFNVVVELS